MTGIEGAASPIAAATNNSGEDAGAAGYGFLSFSNRAGDTQDSGAGFGAVSLSGTAAGGDEESGTGFGGVLIGS